MSDRVHAVILNEKSVKVEMAETPEKVFANIAHAQSLDLPKIQDLDAWRSLVKVAVVGGGPSLKQTIETLKRYMYVFACGSCHDFLIENGVIPTYTIVLDPSPIVNLYLKHVNKETIYLVSTQCCPETFEHLLSKGAKIYKWNAAGPDEHNSIFPKDDFMLGGGCTVGSRTILIAYNMGYTNIDLFGFDTCITEEGDHAYKLNDPAEMLGEIYDVAVGGIPFKMAGYMMAQMIDFKRILSYYGDKMVFDIHGPGALRTLMELAKQKVLEDGKKV